MKLVIAALLVFGVLINSISAIGEEPVPFAALMHSASAQPAVPPMNDQSTAMSTPPAHHRITSGGRAMIGTGIGLVVIGALDMAVTAAVGSWASSTDRAKLYGASAGLLAGGTTLIVFGAHRRTTR